MGLLGDMLDSVGEGVAEATSSGGSNLQGFLKKFNSAEGLWVDKIDTLHTFDIVFKFFPAIGDVTPKSGWDKVLDSFTSAASDMVKSALNNVTGGLVGAIANSGKVTDEKSYDTGMTFIEYLARGNMINGSGDWFGGAQDKVSDQLIIDFSYYVQNIQLPQIQMRDEGTVETLVGDFPLNGKYIRPTQNTFTLDILNTKAPIAERIFYPWMREVTLPFWSYEEEPYSTANVEISFEKHADMKYLFVGCRPSNIESLKPSNELGSPIRTVTMMFDYMFVLSELDRTESAGDKLLDVGKSVLGGAANMLGL